MILKLKIMGIIIMIIYRRIRSVLWVICFGGLWDVVFKSIKYVLKIFIFLFFVVGVIIAFLLDKSNRIREYDIIPDYLKDYN